MGARVGGSVGAAVGVAVGKPVGETVGDVVGIAVGTAVGASVHIEEKHVPGQKCVTLIPLKVSPQKKKSSVPHKGGSGMPLQV